MLLLLLLLSLLLVVVVVFHDKFISYYQIWVPTTLTRFHDFDTIYWHKPQVLD